MNSNHKQVKTHTQVNIGTATNTTHIQVKSHIPIYFGSNNNGLIPQLFGLIGHSNNSHTQFSAVPVLSKLCRVSDCTKCKPGKTHYCKTCGGRDVTHHSNECKKLKSR